MNNNQFRRLVSDTPARHAENAEPSPRPSALGAKKSSFMPMTPRAVKGGIDVDFARQVRERNAALHPAKKFKTAAPKGVKYGSGYVDRAKARVDDAEEGKGEGEDKEARIRALEEQMKLGQLSRETFEALRDQIAGGEIESTHLVKGLDRRLLERVRRGENVLESGDGDTKVESNVPDVDEQLDELEEREVREVKKEKAEKKGSLAVAGVKRSRDEIMAELRAQRKAAAEANAAPLLDGRWKKVGEREKSRIEYDRKGREVIITVDEDGIIKKKVRKVPVQGDPKGDADLAMPGVSQAVLGADTAVPEAKKLEAATDSDDDIFEGVGAEYNPLGDQEDEDEDGSSDAESLPSAPKDRAIINGDPGKPDMDDDDDDDEEDEPSSFNSQDHPAENQQASQPPAPAPRNYFNDTPTTTEPPSQDRLAGVEDLLKKAAKIDTPSANNNATDENTARLHKRAQMLSQHDRDLEDLDVGFGGSRYADDEDDDGDGGGKRARLSEWKGSGAGDGGEQEGGKDRRSEREETGKKKRKPKKRKGDVNSAKDIMRVVEARRG